MKKITAIIVAVVLAFVIAMGDQIIKLTISDSTSGLSAIKAFFGFGDDGLIDITTPKIPSISTKKEEETNLTYDERINKGDYYYKGGFLVYAANEYTKAANLEPTRTKPYLKLMQTHFELMDYSKAKSNAQQVLKLESSNFQAQYYLILLAIKQNDFTTAENSIDQLITAGTADSRLTYYKALIQIANDKHDDAKKLLKQLSADTTLESSLSGNVKKILAAYEEYEFAKAAEELYLSELLARSLNEVGEYEVAIYKLKNILRSRSDLRDGWILLGFSYLNLEKYLFALTAFEKAYELDSEWPATQYFLGVTYAELTKYSDAIVYLNYALNNGFEPSIVIKQKLADLYLQTQEYQKSVTAYEEVLNYNKQDINAYVRPIWIYLDFLNEPTKAVKLAEMAVMTFPNDPSAYNLLGWSQVGTGNYTEAEKNLNKAIAGDPNLAAAHYNLGKMYEEQGRDQLALESFQKAYNLDQSGSIGNLAAKRYNALLAE